MLQVQNLHKNYGTAVILDGVSFILNDGEHIALIGPNGSGKTTILRCITGREQPDLGTIVLSPRGATIGYLAQAFEQLGDLTVSDVVASARAELVEAERAMQDAADALTDMPAIWTPLCRHTRRHLRALRRSAATSASIARPPSCRVCNWPMSRPMLSPPRLVGGRRRALGLALLLLQEPDLLLLDEPTNHLDVEALEWLEGFVQGYKGSMLVVSHDREFLDRTVSRVLYLDPQTHLVRSYEGNYRPSPRRERGRKKRTGRRGCGSRSTW